MAIPKRKLTEKKFWPRQATNKWRRFGSGTTPMQSNETHNVPAAAAQASAPSDIPSSEDLFDMALSLRDDALSALRSNEDLRTRTRKLTNSVPWRTSPYAKVALWLLSDLEVHDCRWRWMAKKVRDSTAEMPSSLAALPPTKRPRPEDEESIVPFAGIVLSAALSHEDSIRHKQSLQLHKIHKASDALCKAMHKAGTKL